MLWVTKSMKFQGQLILCHSRLPRYQIKMPLLCVCFLLSFSPCFTMTQWPSNAYLLLQLLSSLPEWSRINVLDQQFQLSHCRPSCWICKLWIYIELMKAERGSHITATLNASLSKRNVITTRHVHNRLINLRKVTTMNWSYGSVSENSRS